MPMKVFRERYLHGRKPEIPLHSWEAIPTPQTRPCCACQDRCILQGCVSHLPQLLVVLDTLLPPKGVPAVLQEEALSSGTSASMTLPPPGEGDCTGVAPLANAPAQHCLLEARHAILLCSTTAD